jgi:hypothetical protein
MMKTLLFATAAVTAFAAVAAPASARARHGHYYGVVTGTGEGVTGRGYDLSGPGGTGVSLGTRSYGYVGRRYGYARARAYGYVPYNYGSYCGQLPKAC